MKNKKLLCVIGGIVAILIVVLVLFKTHVLCIHDWAEATCDEPKTCTICGDTEGEPLTHVVKTWNISVNPTCSAVGEQYGSCELCGKVLSDTIEKLEHTPGEWVVMEEYVINSDATVTPGVESHMCAVCGEVIETREYTIELTTSQKNSLKTAAKLISSIHPSYTFLTGELLVNCEGFSPEDAKFAGDYCGADWDEQAVLFCQGKIREGESENYIRDDMRWYGFTEEQINYALSQSEYAE